MERTYEPLMRHFSMIEGLQQEYVLTYALEDLSGKGCLLTLTRTGAGAQTVNLFVPLAPERAYRLLQYLSENCIQPEFGRDIVEGLCPCCPV